MPARKTSTRQARARAAERVLIATMTLAAIAFFATPTYMILNGYDTSGHVPIAFMPSLIVMILGMGIAGLIDPKSFR